MLSSDSQEQFASQAAAIRALQVLCTSCPAKKGCELAFPSRECLARVRSIEFHEKLKEALNSLDYDSEEDEAAIEEFYVRQKDVWQKAVGERHQ
jgi:hypothetical protein